MTDRRSLVKILGGAALLGIAHSAGAQKAKSFTIAYLALLPGEDRNFVPNFLHRLDQLGYVDGQNLHFVYRSAEGRPELLSGLASDLVRMKPDVLVTGFGTVAAKAGKAAGDGIPVVFMAVGDPVGAGVVASLARPGGNVTGFTPSEFSIGGKMLEVLKDLAPEITRAAAILVPDLGDQIGMWRTIEAAAPSLGVQATLAGVQDVSDLEPAIRSFASNSNGGLIVVGNRVTIAHRELTISLAARYRLPAIYSYKFFVADGGLASYGSELTEQYRRAAGYVDRILRGESPSVLPVQQPTKFELAINLKTAKALGLTVPPTLFARADEIIE
jgi:putative tryptophan/tyrosine transport system substrate-binding protein